MPQNIFKILSDPTRIKIIENLAKGEICACKFVSLTGRAQPTVSLQLRLLEDSMVVKSRKEGRSIYFSLRDRKVLNLITLARKIA